MCACPCRRDSLLLDCVPLSAGSNVSECFVDGLSVVDECAPANMSALPLADMLGVGWGTDGADGSLCSLSPADDPVCWLPPLCCTTQCAL